MAVSGYREVAAADKIIGREEQGRKENGRREGEWEKREERNRLAGVTARGGDDELPAWGQQVTTMTTKEGAGGPLFFCHNLKFVTKIRWQNWVTTKLVTEINHLFLRCRKLVFSVILMRIYCSHRIFGNNFMTNVVSPKKRWQFQITQQPIFGEYSITIY